MNEIDYVFPYVDGSDTVWLDNYRETRRKLNLSTDINPVRFRQWDNLKYIFRGIEKNMPWIRKIHMIVSNPEQVPDWIDTEKVHIVYHKDIIPEEFLPTFNSCTIEMFLGNIDGLADKFIYANDDFFPVNKMEEDDFFINNIPKLSYKTDKGQGTMFKRVEYNSQRMIADYLHKVLPSPEESFIKIPHTLVPLSKETLRVVNRIFGTNLYNSCTPFRKEKNYNQYVYTYYQLLTKQYIEDDKRNYRYFQFKKDEYSLDKAKKIAFFIEKGKFQTICINDTVDFKTNEEFEFVKKTINNAFEKLFPTRSKYEKVEIKIVEKNFELNKVLDSVCAKFTPENREEEIEFVFGICKLIENIKNGVLNYSKDLDDSSEDEE